jgi:hypothetical protein
MQWEHVVVLTGQDLVASLRDQPVSKSSSRPPAWLALAAAFFSMA